MNTNTNTAVAVIAPKMQPKPTKAEILEALVQVRCKQIREENALIQKRLDAVEAKLEKGILKFFKANWNKLAKVSALGDSARTSTYGKYAAVHLVGETCPTLELPETLREYQAEVVSLNKKKHSEYDLARTVRNQLREKMANRVDTSVRVAALAAMPEMKTMLASLIVAPTVTEVATAIEA